MKLSVLRLITVLLLTLALAIPASAGTVRVLMKTSLGEIELELDGAKAPKSVENFLRYVDEGFYSGTVFHRVINGFMIQGGGFTPDLMKKATHAPIANESSNGLKNLRGTIAMARLPNPDSATSQFFINHADNPDLDYPKARGSGYAVFGRVTRGMETVDRIADVFTGSRYEMSNVPNQPVIIESVTRVFDSK
jgi:cyclophilin family peptidyl-prolyl cis-trans isomerase